MGNFIDGFREFFADPIGVLEAMGQKTMDRYEEEGLCYAAGYLSIDVGLTVCGGLKGLKSLTSLKFVDNATDTAQLAKHAENVVDIVDDTTDMAKIVENGNDVADSASDVGKVAEGGLNSIQVFRLLLPYPYPFQTCHTFSSFPAFFLLLQKVSS